MKKDIPSYLLNSLSSDLQEGRSVADSFFDQVFPPAIQKLSNTHWTPVEVALEAIKLLSFKEGTKILDVGSGSGKFCLVSALARKDSQLFGVEQRDYLNLVAREIAQDLQLKNVTFIDGDAFSLNWNEFDAFYFFNPFWENHLFPHQRIDVNVPVKKENFEHYINQVILRLEKLKKGTHVITYHGFGGKFPPSYECVHFKTCGSDQIKLWVKK